VISRHWKGVARPGQADVYVHHLKTDTFPALARISRYDQRVVHYEIVD
jgi:hypothetical protein